MKLQPEIGDKIERARDVAEDAGGRALADLQP